MARIIFSLQELVEIAVSNALLPRQIVRVRANGRRINFVIRTDSFILPFIPASLEYVRFDGSNVIFELTIVSGHLNKAMGWLQSRLTSGKLKMPAFVNLDFPNVSVDIDRLLKEKKIRGIRVKDILFEDEKYVIVTDTASQSPLD
jgi:hypothetical protein